MTTTQGPNPEFIAKMVAILRSQVEAQYHNPTTGTEVYLFLSHAAEHLMEEPLTYNTRKASQLLEAKADLIMAETRIASWFVDLGFDGQCQVEDSSIGGVPCIMVNEDDKV